MSETALKGRQMTANEDQGSALASTVTAAERVLSDTCKAPVRLGQPERLTDEERRNIVLRCTVAEGPIGVPDSVIIKQAVPDRYDPEDSSHGSGAWGLFNDWAGTQFLTDLTPEIPQCPRFYGGDRQAGLVVLEDLGSGDTLVEPLLGDDSSNAARWLLQLAKTLGHMHASTAGRAAEFAMLRARLDGKEQGGQSGQIRQALAQLPEALASIGISPSTRLDREVESVMAALEAPGPFLAYTHGDPCPDNCLQVGSNLRLIDFELGRFRHALSDGVYGHIFFPTCWCAGRVPAEIVTQMEATYRHELARGCPEAEDDHLFDRAVVECCAAWTLGTLTWIVGLEEVLERNEEWGIATIRSRIVTRLDAFVGISEQRGHLSEIREAAALAAEELRRRWTPETSALPFYPAFR
jgi:hypothetical protein